MINTTDSPILSEENANIHDAFARFDKTNHTADF